MKRIKIAQIGVGHDHAGQMFNTLRNMSDVFDVVGYAIPEDDVTDNEWELVHLENQSRMYQGARQYTVEEILSMPDLDAVAIETFDLLLVKYAKMAAERGLNVHMDKAPGESAEEYESLLSIIKQKKLAFSIGYMYRFNPFVKQIFQMNKNGEFGKIHSVDAEMSCFFVKGKRDWLCNFQGGMMQYLGCHLIDLVVRLIGVPEEIIPTNVSTRYQGTQGKDCSLAVLRYPNGVSTVKSEMGDYGGFFRRHIVVNGEKQTVQISPIETNGVSAKFKNPNTSIMKTYKIDSWGDKGESVTSEVFDRYEELLLTFAKMIRGEKGYTVDLETEAIVHRCLLAACGIPCDYKKEIVL